MMCVLDYSNIQRLMAPTVPAVPSVTTIAVSVQTISATGIISGPPGSTVAEHGPEQYCEQPQHPGKNVLQAAVPIHALHPLSFSSLR